MPPACCARRISGVAAAILPAALLAVLPKCPLCLAAALTLSTGAGFSAPGANWLRVLLAGLSILAAVPLVRRALRRLPSR
ncbi:MAG: hypothetical protein JWN34_3017 [Bryobacterales bacterium]|jgi:hypothetical protein|nr:hypothetical protein [Bryobacterales bacterium]